MHDETVTEEDVLQLDPLHEAKALLDTFAFTRFQNGRAGFHTVADQAPVDAEIAKALIARVQAVATVDVAISLRALRDHFIAKDAGIVETKPTPADKK